MGAAHGRHAPQAAGGLHRLGRLCAHVQQEDPGHVRGIHGETPPPPSDPGRVWSLLRPLQHWAHCRSCRRALTDASTHPRPPTPTLPFIFKQGTKREVLLEKILAHFPPVFHKWQLARFPEPAAWLSARLAFTRTAAAWSMVGHIVGEAGSLCCGRRQREMSVAAGGTGECVWVGSGGGRRRGRGGAYGRELPALTASWDLMMSTSPVTAAPCTARVLRACRSRTRPCVCRSSELSNLHPHTRPPSPAGQGDHHGENILIYHNCIPCSLFPLQAWEIATARTS